MTLTLLLIRHAKAAPQGPAQSDHDRPLAERGRRDAPRMGRWIAEQGLAPGEVLCSDAARTRETLELMLPHWPEAPRIAHRADLYYVGPEAMLRALKEATSARVALVNHNPGIAELATQLARKTFKHKRWSDFPTASVAALDFEASSWADIQKGQGEVRAFVIPADLDGD